MLKVTMKNVFTIVSYGLASTLYLIATTDLDSRISTYRNGGGNSRLRNTRDDIDTPRRSRTSRIGRRVVYSYDDDQRTKSIMDFLKLSSFFVSEASYHTVEPMSYTDSDDDDEQSSYDDIMNNEFDESCQAVKALPTRPACNNIHELDLLDDEVVASGGWRIAWRMKAYDDDDIDDEDLCLKTIKFKTHLFSSSVLQRHSFDATMTEYLSSSPNTINVWLLCPYYYKQLC